MKLEITKHSPKMLNRCLALYPKEELEHKPIPMLGKEQARLYVTFAPAKINLYLDLLSVQSSGYCNLQTAMHEICFADALFLVHTKENVSREQLLSFLHLHLDMQTLERALNLQKDKFKLQVKADKTSYPSFFEREVIRPFQTLLKNKKVWEEVLEQEESFSFSSFTLHAYLLGSTKEEAKRFWSLPNHSILKAFELYFASYPASIKGHIYLFIAKQIPQGGGLGGGTSDGAQILHLLSSLTWQKKSFESSWSVDGQKNKLTNVKTFEVDLDEKEIDKYCLLAEKIGMDAVFQYLGGSCVMSYRGEKFLQNLPCKKLPMLLILPPYGQSTQLAYEKFKKQAYTKLKRSSSDEFLHFWEENHLEEAFRFAENSFAQLLQEECPEPKWLQEAKRLREEGKIPSFVSNLCGSGSSWFVLFTDKKEQELSLPKLLARVLPKEKYKFKTFSATYDLCIAEDEEGYHYLLTSLLGREELSEEI